MVVLPLSTYQSLTAFYLSLVISSLYDLFDTCYGLNTIESYLSLFNFSAYGINEFVLLYFLHTSCSYDKVKDLTVADPEPGALTSGLGQSGLARGSSYEGFGGGGSNTSLQSLGSNGGSSGYQASQENGFGSSNNRLQTIQSLGSDPDSVNMPRSASQRSFSSNGSGGSRGRASPPAPPAPAQTARTTSSPVPPPAPDLAAGRSASVPSAKPSARKAKKLEVDPDKDFFDSFGV